MTGLSMPRKKVYLLRTESHDAPLWKGKPPLLGKLDIELTERCNNNCIHCCINLPADDHTARDRELSTEEMKRIFAEAASLGCLSIRFTGGEPLLREDFEELYISARKLGMKVLIFTNATLINPHLAELFAHIPPIDRIEITVYGMARKSYEAVTRTPGSFDAAWQGINLLMERGVPFVVKGAVLPPNRGEIEEFETWAAAIPWMDGPPYYSMFFDLRCRRDSEKKNLLIKGLRLSPEEGLNFLTRDPEKYRKDTGDFCSRFIGPQGDKLLSCAAGIGSGCVDAYGCFQVCMMLRHPGVVYNLREGTLKDALTNYFPEVRKMKAENPVYLARCAKCFLKGLCEQCPAKSWMEHGALDTPVEYFCQVAHIQARYLGLLEAGENAWEVENWEERIKTLAGSEVGSS